MFRQDHTQRGRERERERTSLFRHPVEQSPPQKAERLKGSPSKVEERERDANCSNAATAKTNLFPEKGREGKKDE